MMNFEEFLFYNHHQAFHSHPKGKYNLRKVIFPKCFKNVITLLNDIKEIMKK